MRCRLAVAVRDELDARKRALGLMTHDDQLTRLLDTLKGPRGADAVAMLRERYRVVLIDEFQDTDPIQWEIVDARSASRRAAARRAETDARPDRRPQAGDLRLPRRRRLRLPRRRRRAPARGRRSSVNRRSDQPLLDGLDALFGHARLGHPGIVYRQVVGGARQSHAAPARRTERGRAARAAARRERALGRAHRRAAFPTPSRRGASSPATSPPTSSRCSTPAPTIETRDDEGKTRRHASGRAGLTSPCWCAPIATPG